MLRPSSALGVNASVGASPTVPYTLRGKTRWREGQLAPPFCISGYTSSTRICGYLMSKGPETKAARRRVEEVSGEGGGASWGARRTVAAGEVRDGGRFCHERAL